MLFESMELLLLRQRHERVRTDGRRVSVFGQITPKDDELDDDVKQAVNDNRKAYFDEEDIDGLTRIKEQQGSGWCIEEVDPAQNTVRVSTVTAIIRSLTKLCNTLLIFCWIWSESSRSDPDLVPSKAL